LGWITLGRLIVLEEGPYPMPDKKEHTASAGQRAEKEKKQASVFSLPVGGKNS
jgi:hypothetical protein